MGMKIKQESRVKTFFKKLFKISRKNNKDGSWKHTKLDREALYALSRESGLNVISRSRDHLDNADKQNNVDKVNSDKDLSVEEVTVGDIFEDTSAVQSNESNTKVKLNIGLNKNVKNIQAYEELCDENDTILKRDGNNRKSKKRNTTKKASNKNSTQTVEDNEQSTNRQEQDLLDVDLDLVLSSFPNLKHPPQNEQGLSTETSDNTRNEELTRQAKISSGSIRQVEAIIESTRNNRDASEQKPLERNGTEACTLETDRYDQTDEVWEVLTVENVGRTDVLLAKKKRKHKKSHASNTENSEDVIVESPKDAKNRTERQMTKPKRRRKVRQDRNLHNAEKNPDVIQSEVCSSTEPLIMAESTKPARKYHRRTNSQSYSVLKEVDETEIPIEVTVQTKKDTKKKNKRNKKKGNVRKPEDDLAADLSEIPKRHKHQMMWDPDAIIEQPTTCSSDEDMGSRNKKTKKGKRRRIRFKINRDKKRLAVKRYDELSERDDNETQAKDHGTSSPKDVGRRMWRACKSGWKYLRAGLVYYTRTPAAGISFSPIVKRYDDEFGDGGGPFSFA